MERIALIVLSACAVVGMSTATFEASALMKISDANKAQQRTLVCFDYRGQVTHDDVFKECRTMAIRELDQ